MIFPDGVNIASSEVTSAGAVNVVSSTWNISTKCNSTQWLALQAKGCVFLPASGDRTGTKVENVGVYGYSWSSTPINSTSAYSVGFLENDMNQSGVHIRYFGRPVRLVRE